MDFTPFTVRLLILATPGIVGHLVYGKLKSPHGHSSLRPLLQICLFSVFSYATISTISSCPRIIINMIYGIDQVDETPDIINSIADPATTIDAWVVFIATAIAIVYAFLASYIHAHKCINAIARTLRVSNRFGEDDVWEYLHSSDDIEWVYVRDHSCNLLYYGSIHLYSESEKNRELVLKDVSVHANIDGKILYDCAYLYVCRDNYALTIEVSTEVAEALAQQKQKRAEDRRTALEDTRRRRRRSWTQLAIRSTAMWRTIVRHVVVALEKTKWRKPRKPNPRNRTTLWRAP